MGENSEISWTDHTFNYWIGCTEVPDSPACQGCYARDLSNFHGWAKWGKGEPRYLTSKSNRSKPFFWDKKAARLGIRYRVFCSSLSDIFDSEIRAEWRADLFKIIANTPNLDWLILTKRPTNILKMLPDDWGEGYPNVWLGTSVENQHWADRRIPALLGVRAKVRFLSCEPLTGHVCLNFLTGNYKDDAENKRRVFQTYIDGIHWVIAGGFSGPLATPMHPEWVRSLRDQCVRAGVPFHFKQWGNWIPVSETDDAFCESLYSPVPEGWPPDSTRRCKVDTTVLQINGTVGNTYPHGAMMMFNVGKKKAGRLLDGREWNEFPEVK